jgi:hypothetical protein
LTFAAESLTLIINVSSEMPPEVFNCLAHAPQAPIAHLAEDREWGMSGQFSGSLSFDELPERISTTPTPAPRSVRPSADSLGISDTGTDRAALEAAPPAPTSHRRGAELGRQVGILLHLTCIAFVGTAITVVFFGIAFSLLRHPTGEGVANSGARDRHMAPVGAKAEMPLSAPTLSAVPSRSAPMPPAGEAATSAAPVAPLRADLPASASTLPGTTPAITGLTASESGLTQLSTMGAQPEQAMSPNAVAETPGVPPQPFFEPITGQTGEHSGVKRPVNAAAEIVQGVVADAIDAMTWVVGGQIVNLWGIRPGPPSLFPSLIGFADQVRAKGAVECRRQTHSNRYRCLMATGEDLAEAALLAGVGRAADGATGAYRTAEAQAHQRNRGLWARP